MVIVLWDYKVALLWTILCTNRHDTLTKTLTQNSSIDSHLFQWVNCQECRPPSKTKDRTQGCLERTPWNLVFRGPRCLVFVQLDPDHPGSTPFWNKVYSEYYQQNEAKRESVRIKEIILD